MESSNGTSPAFSSTSAAFRAHLPELEQPRFQEMRQQDHIEYANAFFSNHNPPWLYDLVQEWLRLCQEPFIGVTNNGTIIPHLFCPQDEGVDIRAIVSATEKLLSQLTYAQREKLQFPLSAPERRAWSNPEILISPFGLRLETLPANLSTSILAILKATLSSEGYLKAISTMRINAFLGSLVKAPKVMNEGSYNFLLFGVPSSAGPWGWSFYGHHLCLNVFLWGSQVVMSPMFTGAEPNLIDTGEHAGTRILHREEAMGLELMRSLTPEMQRKARIFEKMHDERMPEGRWNKDDQRHLCGAFRDNRIVPYEGILVSEMNTTQKNLVGGILEQYLLYLPQRSRMMKVEQCKAYFDETWFSWIGGFGLDDAFYFRVQSPVIVAELDHHTGVFLNNKEPAKFHTHTILRTPNGGDYGFALLNGSREEKS